MKVTNVHGLPAQYVSAAEAVCFRPRREKWISVTELTGAPQIRYLRRLYEDDITTDVHDLLPSLRGIALHDLLHRHTKAQSLSEFRLNIEVDGWTVSGQPDYLEMAEVAAGELIDHKFLSIYGVRDGVKKEYEQQLNLYALLLHRFGITIKKLKLVCLLDGWMASRAATDKTYPQTRAITMEVEMWPIEKAEAYLAERLALHRAAEERGEYPECTPQERWLRPPSWRIVKKNGKRATRVCDSEAMAKKLLAELDPEQKGLYTVDFVWPQATRCESYCSVAKFCVQQQAWLKRQGKRPAATEREE